MKNFDDSFGYWFSGLVDGEGHFGVHFNTRDSGRPRMRVCLTISLRYDDRPTLEYIQKQLGVGTIREHTNFTPTTPNQHLQSYWNVTSRIDFLGVVIPLLDRYPLRTKKQRDYCIWREFIFEWNTMHGSRPFAQDQWDRLRAIAARLRAIRSFEPVSLPEVPQSPYRQIVFLDNGETSHD